jgi:hypothetical protein
VLNRRSKLRVGQSAVANDTIGGKAHAAGRRDDAAAPIAKQVTIGSDLDDRVGDQEVGHDDIGRTGEVRAQHHDPSASVVGDHRAFRIRRASSFETPFQLLNGRNGYETIQYNGPAAQSGQM